MRRYLAICLLLFLCLLFATLEGVMRLHDSIEAQGHVDEAQPADVIIVLGAAVWGGGQPSPSLRARTEHGLALYHAGMAPNMIMSGGTGLGPPSEAAVMRRLALEAGVPDAAIVLDEAASSTLENIANSAALMRQHGWQRAIIVSDPFHLKRALHMAADAGIEAYGSPAQHSPTWTNPDRRAYYVWRETVALLWYYWNGRLSS